MKKLLIAALLTLAACDADRPRPVPSAPVEECQPGDRSCAYDDGTAK